MKKFFLLMLVLTSTLVYSQEFEDCAYYAHYMYIEFKSETVNVSGLDASIGDMIDITYKYKIEKGKYFTYILYGDNYENKWLALHNEEILILYNETQKEPYFFGYFKGGPAPPFISIGYTGAVFTATSTLIEGDVVYSAQNLRNSILDSVWVENAYEYGIGEKITLPDTDLRKMVFINGYISFEKPHLYYENSRVKKIKVSNAKLDKNIYFEIKDTVNPQILEFEKEISGEIIIEIVDVYQGTKYKDTCISSIFKLL